MLGWQVGASAPLPAITQHMQHAVFVVKCYIAVLRSILFSWMRLSSVAAAELVALFSKAKVAMGTNRRATNTFFAVDRYLKSFCYNAGRIGENAASPTVVYCRGQNVTLQICQMKSDH